MMMAKVIDEIAAERRRQIEAEGFDADHDSGADHRMGQLARAASAYAYYAGLSDKEREDRRRDLIKAAALIVAEIERLDRATT
jgi:hypothetical protein